jgi:hypothetical protein
LPKTVQDDREIQPFANWLALQRKGTLANELATAMANVNQAVLETGKPGTITLTIKVKATGDEVSVSVTDEVKVKAPEHDRGQSIFFVDEHGNPHRSQQVLDEQPANQPRLTAVTSADGTTTDPKTGEVL